MLYNILILTYLLKFAFQIPYFEDVGVITLQYLDMLVQKDNLQKSQFFKGLSKVIEKLPLVRTENCSVCTTAVSK